MTPRCLLPFLALHKPRVIKVTYVRSGRYHSICNEYILDPLYLYFQIIEPDSFIVTTGRLGLLSALNSSSALKIAVLRPGGQ